MIEAKQDEEWKHSAALFYGLQIIDWRIATFMYGFGDQRDIPPELPKPMAIHPSYQNGKPDDGVSQEQRDAAQKEAQAMAADMANLMRIPPDQMKKVLHVRRGD